MKSNRHWPLLSCLAALWLVTACVTPEPRDYTDFLNHMPRSILVLPPINETVDANASYSYVTTLSRPLAERGFYVFPVALVDEFMKENGLPMPEDMHQVSLDKLAEIFNPDAVLYVTITEFGQKFELLQSTTRVAARGSLVDVRTGTEIWNGQVDEAQSSDGSGGQGALADLIGAAVAQVAGSVTDNSHALAGEANWHMIDDQHDGLLRGPLHPEYVEGTPQPPP